MASLPLVLFLPLRRGRILVGRDCINIGLGFSYWLKNVPISAAAIVIAFFSSSLLFNWAICFYLLCSLSALTSYQEILGVISLTVNVLIISVLITVTLKKVRPVIQEGYLNGWRARQKTFPWHPRKADKPPRILTSSKQWELSSRQGWLWDDSGYYPYLARICFTVV